jgi:Amt family ammonium transporter
MWFSVKDTGRGIDPTDMDRLFEKFTPASLQTSGKQPSSGLGLNITQRLVELLGGKIEVRSERGVGSRFSVWLPYLNKRRPKSKSDGPEAVLSTRVSRTILVVEPDEQIASLMKLPIEAEGFSVTISADIDHAMAFALQEKPAAVVLEPMLPRKDGWEFLTKLKENPKTQDIPVIIHSIVAEPQLADSLGASANLVKPVTPQKLIDTLMQTMEEGETRQK